ncbi:aquaporin Z [Arthrobacter alpinus]|uniref:Aquaporin Z n=1 Tax=Arthrobacter alpinus TaxID=656366 RepID=A0A1H5EWF8_9MICC|nr:aquaporin [Arthrobacter alpinus]SED95456.1 aquaporin Z [Arthrobacter alpinus]
MTSSGTATAPVQAYPLSTRVAIEGLGSFFIVFAGLGTALFNSTGSAATIGFAYGLAMVAAIVSFGHISNGFFNPAFSLGMAVVGRLKFSAMALYIVAQTIGAVLASVVWLSMMKVMPAGATPETPALFGALANGFDAHSPSQVPMVGVLIVEVVAVAVLTAMVLGITSVRNKTTLGPVAIGVAFAVAVAITMPLSNGSLNPARATSVVFLAESWAAGQLWLFWLAPLVGAALAAAIYRSFVPSAAAAELTDDAEASSGDTVGAVSSEAASSEDVVTGASAGETVAAPVPASGVKSEPARVDDAQAFFDGTKK